MAMREKTLKLDYYFIAAIVAGAAAWWTDSWAPVIAVAFVLLMLWDEERAIERGREGDPTSTRHPRRMRRR